MADTVRTLEIPDFGLKFILPDDVRVDERFLFKVMLDREVVLTVPGRLDVLISATPRRYLQKRADSMYA